MINILEIIWVIFEISVNFYQSFISLYFAYKYLGESEDINKNLLKVTMAYIILLGFTISVINHYYIFEHIYVLFYVIITSIYSFKMLKGSMLEKLFASLMPFIIITSISSVFGNMFIVYFRIEPVYLLSSYSIERFWCVLAVQIFSSFIIYLLLTTLKSTKDFNILKSGEWLVILSMLIFSLVINIFLNFIFGDVGSKESKFYINLIFIFIMIFNICVCFMVVMVSNKNKIELKNELLSVEKEYLENYIKNIKSEHETIKKLKHDYKNSMITVSEMLKSSCNKEFNELNSIINNTNKYLEENLKLFEESEVFITTENIVVNSIVNIKLSKAKSLGIIVNCMSMSSFEGIKDVDLCRLLGNMLDNAIRSCKEVIDYNFENNINTRSELYLKITYDGYKYIFSLTNSKLPHIINKTLRTTKEDKENHGYGTKIIKDIVNDYNGYVQFTEDINIFKCLIILNVSI